MDLTNNIFLFSIYFDIFNILFKLYIKEAKSTHHSPKKAKGKVLPLPFTICNLI